MHAAVTTSFPVAAFLLQADPGLLHVVTHYLGFGVHQPLLNSIHVRMTPSSSANFSKVIVEIIQFVSIFYLFCPLFQSRLEMLITPLPVPSYVQSIDWPESCSSAFYALSTSHTVVKKEKDGLLGPGQTGAKLPHLVQDQLVVPVGRRLLAKYEQVRIRSSLQRTLDALQAHHGGRGRCHRLEGLGDALAGPLEEVVDAL